MKTKPASILALLVLSLAPARAALAWDVTGACTEQEKWELPQTLGPAWPKAFADLLNPAARGDVTMIAFQRLSREPRNPWAKWLGQYGTARALFKMGLYRYAFAEFEKVLQPTAIATATPLMRSAIECLSVIRKKGHPSLLPSGNALETVFRFPLAASEAAGELLAATALQKIRLNAQADVRREVETLQPKPILAKLVQGVQAARLHQDAQAIAYLEPIIKENTRPAFVERSLSMVQLLLARAYYAQRRYAESDKLYRAVNPVAPEFPAALTESSWAALQAGNYPSAINASLNFDTGPLAGVYAPESYLVASIGLFELCRYPEARNRVAEFLRVYGPEFGWLDQWAKTKSAASPYETLVASLKQPSIPPRIQRELSTAPAFVAFQSELNSLVDEQNRLDRYVRSYGQTRRPEFVSLKAGLLAYRASLPRYRQSLIGWLDYEFRDRLKRMHAQLADLKENTDSVLVEIFNAAGEEMISDHSAGSPERAERGLTSVRPYGRGPKMVWGEAPKAGQPPTEVWNDEIGGIEQDLSDRCQPGEKP